MDALITAAGLGTRANLPSNMRKEMLPVYSMRNGKIVLRPMLDCIIYNLHMCGVNKFVVVLNKNDKYTYDYISSLNYKIETVYQELPEGYGNAVLQGKSYFDKDFILNAGDGLILDMESIKMAMNLHLKNNSNIITVMKVKNPERYGVAEISGNNVINIEEKPEKPKSRYALTAFYIFNPEIFDLINGKELTPAIKKLIDNGKSLSAFKIKPYSWASIGNSNDYYKILKRTYFHYNNIITKK